MSLQDILFRPHHFIFNRYWTSNMTEKQNLMTLTQRCQNYLKMSVTELKDYLCSKEKRDYKLDLNELSGALRDAAFFIHSFVRGEKIWLPKETR